jgi:hypothetical protein
LRLNCNVLRRSHHIPLQYAISRKGTHQSGLIGGLTWNPALSLPPKEHEFTGAEIARIKVAMNQFSGRFTSVQPPSELQSSDNISSHRRIVRSCRSVFAR